MTTTRTLTMTRRLAAVGASLAVAVPVGLVMAAPASAATTSETATMLQAMVAEEKLAHDVYTTLGEQYDVRTFTSIARSEDRHQDALRVLLDAYGVTDPTVGDAVGVFDDPAVQHLYDSLIADGSASLAAAAEVGITVEKLDIADLQDALDAGQPADVTRVLENLMAGSQNHLSAFTRLAAGDAVAPADGSGMQNGRGAGMQNGRGAGMQNGRGAGMQGVRDGSCATAS